MTSDVSTFLILLSVMVVGFLSGRIPYEITALCVLFAMFCFGLVPEQAIFSGFSSTAIIVLVMTFFLAGALKKTGIASFLGGYLARISGKGIQKNILVVMIAGALVSSVMPNVATVALLLPAVLKVCSINRIPESKILIPFVFAVIIGGLLTLIGTSGNIVAFELQKQNGMTPFHFFEFTPYAIVFALIGFFFLSRSWYRLLPRRTTVKRRDLKVDLKNTYHLNEERFAITILSSSLLIGKTIRQAKFGALLGLRVVALYTTDERKVFPEPTQVLQSGDRLIVIGSIKATNERLRFNGCELSANGNVAEVQALGYQIKSYETYEAYRLDLKNEQINSIAPRAKFLFGVNRVSVKAFRHLKSAKASFDLMTIFKQSPEDRTEPSLWSRLNNHDFFSITISSNSHLLGSNLSQLLTVRSLGFKILGISRNGISQIVDRAICLEVGDRLICFGSNKKCLLYQAFSGIEISTDSNQLEIESGGFVVTEIVISPRSALIGKSLSMINFRAKYHVQVLALWRQGAVQRGNLAKIHLQSGDALLIQGERHQITIFDQDPDFLMLYNLPESERSGKAVFALLALALMVALTAFNLTSLSIAAFSAVLLILATGTLKMSEAYREVNWTVIFLTASLIPIGMAFNTSGTAAYVSDLLIQQVGDSSLLVVIAVLVVAASLLSQALDVVVAVILIGQLALSLGQQMGIDPHGLLLAVTLSASFAFLTPFSHRANLMVMGVGGYKTKDYFKVGIRLTALLMVSVVLLVWLRYQL